MCKFNINKNLNDSQENNEPTVLPPKEPEDTPPKKYRHDASGSLYLLDDKGDEKLISKSYIEATALTRTGESHEWAKRIEFKNLDGDIRHIDIPCSSLLDPKEPLKLLADAGFDLGCDRKRLGEYLMSYNPTQRIIKIKRSGWASNNSIYICPSFTVSNTEENNTYSLNNDSNNYGYVKQGTLAEWQGEICRYCENNSILTLAVCVSFAAPLLRFILQAGSTIVNLIGKSSIGKTTALNVAGSMWGSSKFIQQWRTTSNALESVSEMHNEGLLILDELSQVSSKDIGNIIYMLGNERGKNRMTSDINIRKFKEWRMSILSSGEIGIVDKIEEEKGTKVQAGQLVRCIDIDVQVHEEYGIYDDLHNFKSGAELSNYLKEAASKYYGTASEAFIKRLVEDPTANQPAEETVKKTYDDMRNNIYEKFNLKRADGQVQRVADVFALYATAGILASADCLGVLTHNASGIEESIFATFGSWFKDRGSNKSFEEQDVIDHVIEFLSQHKLKFRGDNEYTERSIINCLGEKRTEDSNIVFYIYPNSFKEEIYKGFNIKTVKNVLVKNKILELDLDKNKTRYKKVTLCDGTRQRMVVLKIPKNYCDIDENDISNGKNNIESILAPPSPIQRYKS